MELSITQDVAGQYSFGYNDPNSVRQEVKTTDGAVRRAYRYIDTNRVAQAVVTEKPVPTVAAAKSSPAVDAVIPAPAVVAASGEGNKRVTLSSTLDTCRQTQAIF